jgi:hypothetical protein
MTSKAKSKKSNWKGGSFTAAVGCYLRKKAKRAAKRAWSSFKKDTLGIKPKRKKK